VGRLVGAATGLRERCGAEIIGPDRARNAATVAAARAVLGPAFDDEHRAGAALDLAGAFALAAAADVATAAPAAPPIVAAEPTRTTAAVPASVRPPVPAAIPAAVPAAAEPRPASTGAPSARALTVLTFGPTAVVRDGVPVPHAELTPAKARELLLYLALHPGGRTKEQTAVALWPDASPAQVRNAFHVTLHQLRRVLGHKDAVTFDGRAYALAPATAPAGAVTVDCDVAEVLEAAAEVRAADRRLARGGARGPDAADAAGVDAAALARWRLALDRAARGPLGEDEGGDWVAEHQGRVRAAWGEAMEALARLYAVREAPAEAAAVLEALVALEPLREGAHRALMACYAAAGEPARALAHHGALAALLGRELGAAPARETRALVDAIRRSSAAAA
jgi:DNA-binding SARP family transcriptional activator